MKIEEVIKLRERDRLRAKAYTDIAQQSVQDVTGVTPELLWSRSRLKEFCRIRQIVFKLLYDEGFSSVVIGQTLGYDHSTILSGVERIKNLVDFDYQGVKRLYEDVSARFGVMKEEYKIVLDQL